MVLDVLSQVLDVVRIPFGMPAVRGAIVAVLGAVLARMLSRRLEQSLAGSEQMQRARVAASVVRWGATSLSFVWAAEIAGFELGSVLATAGLFTVAVGLAAQAGLSNVIAGLFLLLDRPLAIGDLVQIDGRVGTVEGMSLLSTWVRTLDNVLIRWPNDFVLKASILNFSRNPRRRLDVLATFRPDVDVAVVRARIQEELRSVDGLYDDPPPEVVAWAISALGLELEIRVWAPSERQVELRCAVIEAVHRALRAQLVAVQTAAVAPMPSVGDDLGSVA